MPVATSSRRRKTIRQASSDIEEDQGTQRGRAREDVDDDDEEDDTSARRVKPGKAAAKKTKANGIARAHQEDTDPDDDDEDDRIDVETFADQPLSRADCPKIHGLSQDWANLEEIMHQPSAIINGAAAAMAEVAGEEAQEARAHHILDRIMKGLLDVQALMTGHSKSLSDIIQNITKGDDITDANARYLALVDDMNAEYDKKTSRQKYAKNTEYIEFKETIWEVDHPGTAMPPITDDIPREPGDESDDDEDVVMGGITQEYKCPLTMTPLQDPYTSSVCKHSFSGEAIKDLFKGKIGPQRCPAAGCSKKYTLAMCKPNPELAKKVKAFERREKARRRQQDSDAEDVVD
ncbi:hypothetical protein GGX14DRAFT_361863 [Mycena pura]|uniref:SP-RING-type domain-containing protein n=1 Tax=Mycena pura TaxID=153505 RepID=A0AAD6YCV6_9AGAR|nr:hypothetical protein GGX14DRAFT_361863 [Mycena pura]